MTKEQAENEIKQTVKEASPYCENIISILLNVVAEELGYKIANDIIKKFELKEKFGVQKTWSAIDMLKDKKSLGYPRPTIQEWEQ